MPRLVLRHLRIVGWEREVGDGYIVIKNGYIEEIGAEPAGRIYGDEMSLRGYIAVPGYIDTHTHGIGGMDPLAKPDPYVLLEISRLYARHGVTGFLPSTVSMPPDSITEFCRSLRDAISMWRPENGSRILGAHLEGPYINPEYAGAHDPRFIRSPSLEEFRSYVDACGGYLRQITIAPEIRGSEDIMRFSREVGVVVSAGHTGASYEEGLWAIGLGVSKATHIFNAMRRIHHRDPGIALALLQSSSIYIETIPDLVHLHRAVLKLVIDIAGPERIVLVSDSISAAGMPDGIYSLGGLEVEVREGVCRLRGRDTIAGSVLTLDRGVSNVVGLGYSLREAVMMASTTPARSIGLLHRGGVGAIEPGYAADIAILDNSLRVVKTLVMGVEVYSREG
jgi:N-acetylglucosamine-6-phosphate deacetylase